MEFVLKYNVFVSQKNKFKRIKIKQKMASSPYLTPELKQYIKDNKVNSLKKSIFQKKNWKDRGNFEFFGESIVKREIFRPICLFGEIFGGGIELFLL